MEITEELGRYVLHLQSFKSAEVGEDVTDKQYRARFEELFPAIKEERLDYEFNMWVHSHKMEKDPRMVALREKIEANNVFGEKVKRTHSGWEHYRDRSRELTTELDQLRIILYQEYEAMDDKAELRKEWEIYRMKEALKNG